MINGRQPTGSLRKIDRLGIKQYLSPMYQFFFLSIVTNLLAGVTLAYDRIDEKVNLSALFNPVLFQNSGFRLSLGLVTFVMGFLKLLSVTPGDVPVVGDLFPAVAGMLAGFSLAFQYYRERSEVESATAESLDRVFGRKSAILGIVAIVAGLLHFLLPGVLFL